MSEFEYLAVFVSMIFGISVTHVLAGIIRSVYRGESNQTHLVFTAFFFFVAILNWWTAYSWHDVDVWSFDSFLIIIIWSISHYVAAITLYPPQSTGSEEPFEYQQNWFLWAFVGILITEVLQTAARGDVFTPWYYLPFVAHYLAITLIAIIVNKAKLDRWVAWYLLCSITTWAFVVRRFLIE